jgi:hypothetical protein
MRREIRNLLRFQHVWLCTNGLTSGGARKCELLRMPSAPAVQFLSPRSDSAPQCANLRKLYLFAGTLGAFEDRLGFLAVDPRPLERQMPECQRVYSPILNCIRMGDSPLIMWCDRLSVQR